MFSSVQSYKPAETCFDKYNIFGGELMMISLYINGELINADRCRVGLVFAILFRLRNFPEQFLQGNTRLCAGIFQCPVAFTAKINTVFAKDFCRIYVFRQEVINCIEFLYVHSLLLER